MTDRGPLEKGPPLNMEGDGYNISRMYDKFPDHEKNKSHREQHCTWQMCLSAVKVCDDVHNGHFLDTLELLSHYDPLLDEHLLKVRDQKNVLSRLTHCLGSDSQNELIGLFKSLFIYPS